MHRVAVVPDDQIADPPFVAVDELPAASRARSDRASRRRPSGTGQPTMCEACADRYSVLRPEPGCRRTRRWRDGGYFSRSPGGNSVKPIWPRDQNTSCSTTADRSPPFARRSARRRRRACRRTRSRRRQTARPAAPPPRTACRAPPAPACRRHRCAIAGCRGCRAAAGRRGRAAGCPRRGWRCRRSAGSRAGAGRPATPRGRSPIRRTAPRNRAIGGR